MSGPPGPRALIDGYDAALFDLDGVIYLGPAPVPGAAEGIAALRERQTKLGFLTNNAARSPAAVARHLRDLSVPCDDSDVVTSAQAAAHLLRERCGPGAKILVVGGEGILVALAERELTAVHSADDDPVAVIQGFSFDLTWAQLNEAAIAIQRGAYWVATNTDTTRPTDRGIVPGNGAAVEAVRAAVAAVPEVAGKPFRPLIDETMQRLQVSHPIVVGDRIDTDIAGAGVVGLDSLFVLTGAHGPADLLAAPAGARPTHLGQDLRALLDPERAVRWEANQIRCGAACAWAAGTIVQVRAAADSPGTRLDALWAVAHLAWTAADAGRPLDLEAGLTAVDGLP